MNVGVVGIVLEDVTLLPLLMHIQTETDAGEYDPTLDC